MPVLQLCVVGARARGDATPESDLDVVLLADHVDPNLREKIVAEVRESLTARAESLHLLEKAKQVVEQAILGGSGSEPTSSRRICPNP